MKRQVQDCWGMAAEHDDLSETVVSGALSLLYIVNLTQ